MRKLVCLARIAFLLFLIIGLAGCATNSGNVKGGGTIVGNPEIPFRPKLHRPEQSTPGFDDLAMLRLFRQVKLTGQLSFSWLEDIFNGFRDRPADAPASGN